MIETPLAQIAVVVPVVDSGKIPGQPETPVENVSMVFTGWGNSFQRAQCANHTGRSTCHRMNAWGGLIKNYTEIQGCP